MAEDDGKKYKDFGVGLPLDTKLPLFVYGIFKSDELAYHIIKPFVKGISQSYITRGLLYEKDGIPIFTRIAKPNVEFYRIQGEIHSFSDKGDEAYHSIKDIMPGSLYRWGVIEDDCRKPIANILYANKYVLSEEMTINGSFMLKQSDENNNNNAIVTWQGRFDGLFTKGMRFLQEMFVDKIDYIKFHEDLLSLKNDYYALFKLQMAYAFLWTIIDRHNSMKYGLNLKQAAQISSMAKDECFQDSVRAIGDNFNFNYKKIYASDSGRSRSFTEKKPDSTEDWERILKTYYQVRCNVVHRGKSGHDASDFPKLRGAFKDMFAIMQYMLGEEYK